jgi:hypothetical protein
MRLPNLPLQSGIRTIFLGPQLIGFGVGLLLLNAVWPAMPVVTGMALVALGATSATVKRYCDSQNAAFIVAMNLLVYCGLYALFVGATLHQALFAGGHRLGTFAAVDLVLSMLPLAMAVEQTCSALGIRARSE